MLCNCAGCDYIQCCHFSTGFLPGDQETNGQAGPLGPSSLTMVRKWKLLFCRDCWEGFNEYQPVREKDKLWSQRYTWRPGSVIENDAEVKVMQNGLLEI